jgi:hypothetical protein
MSIKNQMALRRMREVYTEAFEDLLMVRPDLELTRERALDPAFMSRFFGRIEREGIHEGNANLDTIHFKLMASKLGIINSHPIWHQYLNGNNSKPGVLL